MKKELFDAYNRFKAKYANMIVEALKTDYNCRKPLNVVYRYWNEASCCVDEEVLTEMKIVGGECLVRVYSVSDIEELDSIDEAWRISTTLRWTSCSR